MLISVRFKRCISYHYTIRKFHTLLGILPDLGPARYQRMLIGWSASPVMWPPYINAILSSTLDRSKYLAIMDDLLFHSSNMVIWNALKTFWKLCLRMVWKYHPRNANSSELSYKKWETLLLSKTKRVCVKPLKISWEAKQKLSYQREQKIVNHLSKFCPNLQKLPQPIYDLTRNGRPFIWTKIHQDAFEEIKKRWLKPPILHVPDHTGR